MSFGPTDPPPGSPPPGDVPPGSAPGYPPGYGPLPPGYGPPGQPPGYGYPLPWQGPEEARRRVLGPAIGLIIIAVLDLLGAGYFTLNGVVVLQNPDAILAALQQNPALAQMMGDSFNREQAIYSGYFYLGMGLVGLLTTLLILLGGIRMLSLRNYGLAMTASILAAIPCISPSACCLVGMGVGIWGVIVLAMQDVRSAFK